MLRILQKIGCICFYAAVFWDSGIIFKLKACCADENQPKRSFIIAVVPEINKIETEKRYIPLGYYISKNSSIDVKIKFLDSYSEVLKEFSDGRIDAAFLGSFSFLQANLLNGAEPLVRVVENDGTAVYKGYIFTRKDSNIKSPADMEGKRAALVKLTSAGYIFPLYYFLQQSIKDINGYFNKVIFYNSHDAACWAVYNGEADIGAAKDHVFNSLAEKIPDFKKNMLVLAESQDFPSLCLSVRKEAGRSLKLEIKNFFLNIANNNEGKVFLNNLGILKFTEASDEGYKYLYGMIRELNIDLKFSDGDK